MRHIIRKIETKLFKRILRNRAVSRCINSVIMGVRV